MICQVLPDILRRATINLRALDQRPAAACGVSVSNGHNVGIELHTYANSLPPANLSNATTPKDGVTVIVAPVALLNQWEAEIRDFIEPGNIDVFRYETASSGSTAWWDRQFKASKQTELSRRVIIASPKVIVKLYALPH